MMALALVSAACPLKQRTPTRDEVDRQAYANFQTAVAKVSDAPYDVYWLGSAFSLPNGQALKASFAGIGDEATPARLSYSYYAPRQADMSLEMYTGDTWLPQRDWRWSQLKSLTRVDHATVAGHPAEVWITPRSKFDSRVNNLSVIIDFGDTIVVASTTSLPQANDPSDGTGNIPLSEFATIVHTPSPTPLPDLNPLIDEATFLSVLQNLRPYPQ